MAESAIGYPDRTTKFVYSGEKEQGSKQSLLTGHQLKVFALTARHIGEACQQQQ
jgi:hypothetical protein